METRSRTDRSVPLGRGARRTRRGPGVATDGGYGAAQECRVHFLAADTIILHLRARRQPTASTPQGNRIMFVPRFLTDSCDPNLPASVWQRSPPSPRSLAAIDSVPACA
jgi:hypothetical protein